MLHKPSIFFSFLLILMIDALLYASDDETQSFSLDTSRFAGAFKTRAHLPKPLINEIFLSDILSHQDKINFIKAVPFYQRHILLNGPWIEVMLKDLLPQNGGHLTEQEYKYFSSAFFRNIKATILRRMSHYLRVADTGEHQFRCNIRSRFLYREWRFNHVSNQRQAETVYESFLFSMCDLKNLEAHQQYLSWPRSGMIALPRARHWKAATNITGLNLSHNQLDSIHQLSGLTKLRRLNLNYTGISNLSDLQGLHLLTELEINGNQISSVTPLRKFHFLKELIANYNNINSLEALKNLPLEYVLICDNQITDLSPLLEMKCLKTINVSRNPFLFKQQPGERESKFIKRLATNRTVVQILRAVGVAISLNTLR